MIDDEPAPSLARAGVTVELLPDTHTLRLTRNDQPFTTVNEMIGVLEEFEAQIRLVDRAGFALLIDTRRIPLRRDEQFERAFRHFREHVARGFARVAVLVESDDGLAQASTHAASLGPHVNAFADEASALAWLADATSGEGVTPPA